MKKNTKEIKNIGTVSIKDLTICEGSIGLYIPINVMSDPIKERIAELDEDFKKRFAKKHPEVDTSSFTLSHDIALHMYLDTEKFEDREETTVMYQVNTIIWYTETENTEYEETDVDTAFEIDINADDSRYLKKLVMNKLLEVFF